MPHRRSRKSSAIFLCAVMTLFWWQSTIYSVHGESGDSTISVPVAMVQDSSVFMEDSDLQGGKKLITVQQGDTLSGIARKYGTTVAEIATVNEIRKPDAIQAGQKLWVIAKGGQFAAQNQDQEQIQNRIQDLNLIENQKQGNLFYVNYILSPAFDGNSKEQKAVAEKSSSDLVEFFVDSDKEEKIVQNDKLNDRQSYTMLREPLMTSPVQVTGEKEQSAPASRGAKKFSEEDVELLARVIYAEARGENFEGQKAVGAVVLNRLEDPRFPKTIREIIYQPGAFTAVIDKQIHLTPDDEAFRAAEAALAGEDPTGGALYYYNPKTATDRWIKSRPVIKTIGNHTFSI